MPSLALDPNSQLEKKQTMITQETCLVEASLTAPTSAPLMRRQLTGAELDAVNGGLVVPILIGAVIGTAIVYGIGYAVGKRT